MLNQRPKFGRKALGFLDHTLIKEENEGLHSYVDDCTLTWDIFWYKIDHYYLVHWLDWFVASFLFRDALIMHFWQVFYEIIELSAQHRLPHFTECWWDHVLTDILLSNTPAVVLGMWTLDKLGIRRYDWLGRYGKDSISDWEIWKCHRRWGNNCLHLVLFSMHFLCSFFLMNAFLIQPTHKWVAMRMILWACASSLGFREAYADLETWNTPERKHTPIEGRYRWICMAVILTESLVCYKYSAGTGHVTDPATHPTPLYISIPWVSGILYLAGGYLYLRFKPGRTLKYPGIDQEGKVGSVSPPASARKRKSTSPGKKSKTH